MNFPAGWLAITFRIQKNDTLCVNLGRVLLHAFFVFPLARLDLASDADETSFSEILLTVLSLGSPDDDLVPLGSLLSLS